MASCYVITDGSGNYMKISGTGIINTTTESDATKWVFSENGANPHGYIYSASDSTKRITINGTSLTVNNTGTNWSYDGTNIFSGTSVIKFDGTNWVLDTKNTYLIQYNGHYLRYNNGLKDTTTKSQGTLWTLSNTLININGNGTISYTTGGKTYYLRYNNGLTTTTNSGSATTWQHDDYGIYYTYNSIKRYIQYDSGWKAQQVAQDTCQQYYIRYGISDGWSTTYHCFTRSGTSITDSTNQSEAGRWIFTTSGTNPSGVVYQISGSTRYYLQLTASGPSISTKASHTFTNSNGYLYDTNTGYYLYPMTSIEDNGWWETTVFVGWTTSSSQPSNKPSYSNYGSISFENYDNTPFASISVYTNFISRGDVTTINLSRMSGAAYDLISTSTRLASVFNCIPINAASSSPYGTDTNNTGYIMSGGYDTSINCDIRVSYFAQSYISDSWSSGWVENSVYTIGTSGLGKIIESGNGSGTYYPVSDFSKFNSAKSQLVTTLNNSNSRVYGLHFMDASITKEHIVTTESVLINGDTYTNYQMPEDCIDFNLKSKGSINCFSGYYFNGNGGTNNAFFSLHEIIRNSDKTINKILHILKVYENKEDTEDGVPDGTYVYQYINDDDSTDTGYYYWNAKEKRYITVSSFNSSNYDLVFDKDWIEDPVQFGGTYNTTSSFFNQYQNNFFYFEIPVNAGEYALGSVAGKCGTYLVYLDIGANASVVDRTTVTEQMDKTVADYTYTNGIQLLANNTSYTSDANSAVAIIPASTTGTFTISRTGDAVTFSTAMDSSYWDPRLTVTNGTLTVPEVTVTTKVLKYLDFNNGTNTLYYTTLRDIGGTQTYEVREINDTSDLKNDTLNPVIATHESTSEQIAAANYGLLKPGTGTDAGYGVADTAANAISTNTFSNTITTLDYYFFIDTNDFGQTAEEYDLSVEQITGDATIGSYDITGGTYTFTDGYTATHCYNLVSTDIRMAPNELVVYMSATPQATITGPSDDLATVTTTISGTTYTFTFNASEVDNTNKTITIYINVML